MKKKTRLVIPRRGAHIIKKTIEFVITIATITACVILVVITWFRATSVHFVSAPIAPVPITAAPTTHRSAEPAVQTTVPAKPRSIRVQISDQSPEIFANAHGTAMAHGKIFIGMADRNGNPFPTNQLYIFPDTGNLDHFSVVSLPKEQDAGSAEKRKQADIESMVYDERNDKIYFIFSDYSSFSLYSLDPSTYELALIMATTSLSVGDKPAITTDGEYIYGITYTEPATVFKVGISGEPFLENSVGHISDGHSAAVGSNGPRTELYFGGGQDDGFEKVNAADLASLGTISLPGCAPTDDMPYQKITETGGYVYVGCEKMPYGYRVKTDDLSTTRFDLPGNSFGLFIYGSDLYNAAVDGNIDIFRDTDITKIQRYYVGQDMPLNELFVATTTHDVYFTEWYGPKGLFEVKNTVNNSVQTSSIFDAASNWLDDLRGSFRATKPPRSDEDVQ